MKKLIIICLSLLVSFQFVYSQGIEEMQWDKDFQIHITLANDSNYILDIKELHHTDVAEDGSSSFTYLPTRLETDFVNKLKQTEVDTNSLNQEDILNSNKTL